MLSSIFFDRQDREILRMINQILNSEISGNAQKSILDNNLHPHGIVELTTTREFRVAYAVINLLSNLESGSAENRLHALHALHDEVLHSAKTTFRYNTGRVLIQIMKEIVRSQHDRNKQLKLVHDFRRASKGNPRIIRKLLTHHLLLEMPENWTQLTMDHHVHDANTKGRKNATHLIMDAWIKGIKNLTIIYYNYVEPETAREILKAASIVGITVRIGLEFRSPFYGRFINFTWAPRGFSDAEDFLSFLAEKPVCKLISEGKKASLWAQKNVLTALNYWNSIYKQTLSRELDIDLPEISQQEFLAYVGRGQTSFLHLTEYVYKTIKPIINEQIVSLKQTLKGIQEDNQHIKNKIQKLELLTVEAIAERWLKPEKNPDIANLIKPSNDKDIPEIIKLSPADLLKTLVHLRSGYRITLQLAGLTPEDVLELLWDCQGMITHLELFNLKEWQEGHLSHLARINELQRAINTGSALRIKQMMHTMIQNLERITNKDSLERCDKFKSILRNIPKLQEPYKMTLLGSYIGTDSTSNTNLRYGMGFVAPETLPGSPRKLIKKRQTFRPINLPIQVPLYLQKTWILSKPRSKYALKILSTVRSIPGLRFFGMQKKEEWKTISTDIIINNPGNIITMGGISTSLEKNFSPDLPKTKISLFNITNFSYLNTNISNILKILIGFVPATLAFIYTQNSWIMAVFGSTIWFIITGVRNIIQAVLEGGSFYQSSLLRLKNYINWTRICDSLMYTGLSVVLLELIIRSLLLEKVFGYTISNHYFIVFSVISIANGFYISCHNIFRGFPKEAIIGNFFRSILSIPISILYNDILLEIFILFNVANPLLLLESGAAIISKTSSDTVACLIEGFAERRNNYRLRFWDYKTKLEQFFNWYAQLDLYFPEQDMLLLLEHPKKFLKLTSKESPNLLNAGIINALDLMYFWMYQPYAQQTLLSILKTMTKEEQYILTKGQNTLLLVQEVSQLFVNGVMGNKFTHALSFYLNTHEKYLRSIHTITQYTHNTVN